MSEPTVIEMPEVILATPPDDKLSREKRAFLAMLPELLAKCRNQFVAVYEGRVVGVGDDQIAVAKKAYEEHGYVPILVRRVTEQPPPAVRIPSIRVFRGAGG